MSEMTPARGPVGKFNGWLHRLFDSEMFTTKDILRMFYPLMLDQFAIHLIMTLSTSLVSSVGQEALAAVSMVNTLSYVVTAVMFALSAGGGVIIAQAKGSGDEERLHKAVSTTAMLSSGVMLVLSITLTALAGPIIELLYPHTEPLLKEYAVHYMRLNMLTLWPFSLFHVIFTAFRSVGDSKSSLILTLYINVSHLLLSLLFINGLKMGVTGSGLSLIVARVIGAIVAMVWLFGPMGTLHMKPRAFFKLDKQTARPVLRLSVPFCVEQMLFEGGMVVVQGYLSTWGDTPEKSTMALAAYAVASSLVSLYQATGYCITQMTSTVCGQCIGAERIDLCKRYNNSIIKGGNLIYLLTVLVLFPLTPLLMKLYNPNPDALGMIYVMLMVGVFPMPLIWCKSFITSTTMCSAGDVKFATYVSIAVMLIGRMALGYVLTITLNLGPVGIFIGMLAEWLLRIPAVEWRYRSGKWLHFLHQNKASG